MQMQRKNDVSEKRHAFALLKVSCKQIVQATLFL